VNALLDLSDDTRANTVIALLARQLRPGGVVATGVVSPLAILAIAVAKATHAPDLAYLACVGSLDPDLITLERSTEDLVYLQGRRAEVSIADLFDHALRGRVDTVFFGAVEVDGAGRTNMSAIGGLTRPKVKFPGVAGASSLRRWVKRPVLLITHHSLRSLVPAVQVASTSDERPTLLVTNLAVFEVGGAAGATLLGVHPWSSEAEVAAKTGFAYATSPSLAVTEAPSEATVCAIRAFDSLNLRQSLVG
jgi:glutaconate CoA-transferase subunit B